VKLSTEHQKYDWLSARDGLALNVDPYLRKGLQELAGES